MFHYAINVTNTEVEFFTIRCGINQVLHLQNISKIIVITDSIYIYYKMKKYEKKFTYILVEEYYFISL